MNNITPPSSSKQPAPIKFGKDAVVTAYKRYAPVYDWVFGGVLEGGRREMAAMIRKAPPKRLLEVGVGTGLALHQYPRSAAITGIDISEPMLDVARQRVRDMNLGPIELLCADAEQLPFEDSSFDCVTLPYVLSVTPNPQALIDELRRVCTPDGTIYIVNHFSDTQGWGPLEALAKPLSRWIGFDSKLDMASTIHAQDWHLVDQKSVNLMGLSKLVVLKNMKSVNGAAMNGAAHAGVNGSSHHAMNGAAIHR
jgi:phosphatidylethanolamine/phosphatidyl-N-methylethanolamine N-methyltransferase